MKKLIFSLVALFALSAVSQAQWVSGANAQVIGTGGAYKLIHFKATVDTSASTYNSQNFNINGFQANVSSTYTYHSMLRCGVGTTGNVNVVSAYLYGSADGSNWTLVDTLALRDSVTTQIYASKYMNTNFYPLYRVTMVGDSSAKPTKNAKGASADLYLFFSKPDR